MEPINWFMTVVTQHYFDFNGRARRAEFWWYALVYIVGAVAIHVIQGILPIGTILSSLYSLALLLPTIGVGVRRLHDSNRTGWLVLLLWIPGIVWGVLTIGALATGSLMGAAMIGSLLVLITLAGFAVLIYFWIQPGTVGDNQYGPDPKAGLS